MEDSVEGGTEGGYTAYPADHPGAMEEYVRRTVERVAKAWYEDPLEDGKRLVWANAHPEDQENARTIVRFVLKQVGWEP